MFLYCTIACSNATTFLGQHISQLTPRAFPHSVNTILKPSSLVFNVRKSLAYHPLPPLLAKNQIITVSIGWLIIENLKDVNFDSRTPTNTRKSKGIFQFKQGKAQKTHKMYHSVEAVSKRRGPLIQNRSEKDFFLRGEYRMHSHPKI